MIPTWLVCQSLVHGQMSRVSQLFKILFWTDLGYVSQLFWTMHGLHVSGSASLLVVVCVPWRGWQSTSGCCIPENKGEMCPKLGQSGTRYSKGQKNSEECGGNQRGERKTKEPLGPLMLWRLCVLDSARSASKWQTVTSDGREWWCQMKQEGGSVVKYVCWRQCQKCFKTENLVTAATLTVCQARTRGRRSRTVEL